MMFLIIKTISEGSEGKNTFKLFDLALDGEYLCSLRYSQLLSFSEEIKKAFPSVELPPFPPKKLLHLDEIQMEERRFTIEKYIQALTLNAQVASSNLFKNYMLAAQFASWDGKEDQVSLSVYLLNGKTVDLKVTALDRADVVQERVSKEMSLPEHLVYYFALHLVQVEEDESLTVLRKIYDFESPYITLNMSAGKTRIVLMRQFWHKDIHTELLADKIGRNLLFLDAAHAYDRGWWSCREEDKKVLDKTHQKNQKKEFLEVVSKQSDYLTTQVHDLHIEVEGVHHMGYSIIGQDTLKLYYVPEGEASAKYQQYVMKMSRVRCWKMAYLRDKSRLTLAVHYLVAKDRMDWVYIWGKSVTFLAQGIQGIVHDLIRIAQKKKIKKPSGESGVIPRLLKFNRREISQPVVPRKQAPPKASSREPPSPTTPTTSAPREPPSPSTPSTGSTSTTAPSTSTVKKTEETATLESAGDEPDAGDKTDGQGSSSQRTSSSGTTTTSGAISSSQKTKPSPPTLPKSFTSVDENVESSKSITNVLKRLTSFKSSEVSNDLFEQAIGDDDL